ncbi:hypothetical protein P7C70_g7940, partial [Phenoliferia sp. Uapishka_3]
MSLQVYRPDFAGVKFPGIHDIVRPRIIKTFTKEDAQYFSSDARLGPGKWAETLAADYGSSFFPLHLFSPSQLVISLALAEQIIASLKASADLLEAKLASPNGYFFSATQPSFKDFTVMGWYRMLAATDPKGAKRVFDGRMGEWVERMRERFKVGLGEVEKRDPVE